ncbi:hypothetical protein [Nocardia stercoris]|uniref:DUF8020 domain-containing protein n=1 Tax=Nocardia stercoris TaxID=2483361 RepID=A0A3M2LHE4_9NOCA|nr:hypothetical protein [Nocardia stercoris]RMI34178.1 hypothetical protein EBN03_07085 [Nocardia stercoris]
MITTKKLIGTAAVAVGSTAIATAMANGQAAAFSLQNSVGPVAYTTTLAADHHSATVDLSSGHFVMASDGTIGVLADDGTNVGTIPTSYTTLNGQNITLGASLNGDATELTLTPTSGPVADPAALDAQAGPLLHEAAVGGAFIGIGIGCFIGVLIGIWIFLVGAIVGCVIGAFIGGAIGLGTPF